MQTLSPYSQFPTQIQAWVIFEDSKDWRMSVFKRNKRHVSLLLKVGDKWVHSNSMMHSNELRVFTNEEVSTMVLNSIDTDIEMLYYQGYTRSKIRGVSIFTCVEQTKRVLGIHAWWILTPNQLYKYIKENM
jgi:hypothetical protein